MTMPIPLRCLNSAKSSQMVQLMCSLMAIMVRHCWQMMVRAALFKVALFAS